jgi:NAD(P)H dehydrogenase (quinone)
MILVTGGTGTIGGALIGRLREQGKATEITAITRKPAELGVATALGDFNTPESIVSHLSPGDRLFLNAMPFPRFVETFNEVIDRAARIGVAQIVLVSVRGAKPGGVASTAKSTSTYGPPACHMRSCIPPALCRT